MSNFDTYQPPGIFIEELTSPLVGNVGLATAVPAIVGPGIGYRVASEAATLDGVSAVQLSRLGITENSVAVYSASGTLYTLTQDYTLAVGGGADGNTGTALDNTLTITRVDANSGGTIANGETVVVTYRHTDAAYYAAKVFTDYEDIKAAYGEPFSQAGVLQSPISLAARIAMLNGASQLVLVAVASGAVPATFASAYTKLLAEPSVGIVVPLTVGLTGSSDNQQLGNDLESHCNSAAISNMYRIGIMGSEALTDNNIAPNALAANVAAERVVLAWPNRMLYFNGFTNASIEVGGYYLAAAYAGRLAAMPVQNGLTRKRVSGFNGIPSTVLSSMIASYKNTLSQAGVSVTEVSRDGSMVVRHGVTTNTAGLLKREISLLRAKDAMVSLIYETINSYDIIGSPITEDSAVQLKAIVQGCLSTLTSSGVIFDYGTVKVRLSSTDPTVMEIKFEYRPSYPLNYIVVSYTLNTETGDLAIAA